MTSQNKFDSVGIRLWYYRSRDSVWYAMTLFGGIIVICFILFFVFIWPQVQRWFSIQDEIAATKQRTLLLQNNFNYVTNSTSDRLNTNFDIVTSALPSQRDFSGIIDSITTSALVANVPLNDFSFPVGEIATTSAKSTKAGIISVNVSIGDGVDGATRFLREVERRVPLVTVNQVNAQKDKTTFVFGFFFKTFPPIQYDDGQSIHQVDVAEQQLISQLSQWKDNQEILRQQETSTVSALTEPPF